MKKAKTTGAVRTKADLHAAITATNDQAVKQFLPVTDSHFTQCSNVIAQFAQTGRYQESRMLRLPSSALPLLP